MEPIALEAPDAWAREAAQLPIAFSQVREDPAVYLAVLAGLPQGARVLMIASGGDTAASVVAGGRVSHLHLVDINPAQLALTHVKLHLLLRYAPSERLSILGHRRTIAAASCRSSPATERLMDAEKRRAALGSILAAEGLAADALGPTELVARLGPDHSGRYEILFSHLRDHLRGFRDGLVELLALDDPAEQARRCDDATPLGRALDGAFKSVMRIENLVCLFGEEATRNARRGFARHFAERTRRALATMPATTNPFLAQMLLGSFQNGETYDWMKRDPLPQRTEIVHTCSTAIAALASLSAGSVDFIHLSNILDWLSPEAAAETLALAWNALRPNGLAIIRQLNSTLDIPACEPRFAWRAEEAAALHQRDRSFFYRALFLGCKVGLA